MAVARAHSHDYSREACAASGGAINASLLAICQAMGAKLELDEVLQTILSLTLQEMRAQQGSVLLYDLMQDQLQMLASIGLPDEIVKKGYIPRKGSFAEWVVQHNEPLILGDKPEVKPDGKDFQAMDDKRRIVSSMCVPLRVGGKVLGTINLNRTDREVGAFEESELDTMLILAGQAAICIENSRLHAANLKTERLAAIGQTVAGISHCIKNILTGVRGGMSLVDMSGQREDWNLHAQGMDILKRNMDRLSSIVLDMLDYSKERKPCKGTVATISIFDEVIGTVRSSAEQHDVSLDRACADDAQRLEADGQQIYRCVLNLVHNAIDISPTGGSIRMSAERTTDAAAIKLMKDRTATAAIVLRVGDDGPGIDAEHLPVIFEPFFSTKGSKGTGLGLAVTRKIIEEHGGTIRVESKPGESAVFAIYLPA